MKKIVLSSVLSVLILIVLFVAFTACTSPNIGVAEAQEIAFTDAKTPEGTALSDLGVQMEQVKFLSVESDWENGIKYYDVEFTVDGVKYEYDVNATTGEIVCKEINDKLIVDESKFIGEEKAKEIALKHANAAIDTAAIVELDFDDGAYVYEIDFQYDSYEYEYVIDAVSGKITESEKDR